VATKTKIPKAYAETAKALHKDLAHFEEFGQQTECSFTAPSGSNAMVPVYLNEFWTSKQRAAHSLHEVSYRACFKPQLPHFFIERLTQPGDIVYDPFMGRGTTPIEASFMGRKAVGCDINPLGAILVRPRLAPPDLDDIQDRLHSLPWLEEEIELPEDLLVFYHQETLKELTFLRQYFLDREKEGKLDTVDQWIRMVAVNRLTGHSGGFFSVYTLPPNQSVTIESQKRINDKREQIPPRRNVPELIFKKSKSLLKDLIKEPMSPIGLEAELVTGDARDTRGIKDNSVDLVVTSPPFLNVVNYAQDSWLRGWFCGFDTSKLNISVTPKIDDWTGFIVDTFLELARVLKKGGWIAFEVGEIDKGKIKLEEHVIPAAQEAGLHAELVLINEQGFTKTAQCWGVDNNTKGTNTNRVILLRHS
jgi:hypothetical protein